MRQALVALAALLVVGCDDAKRAVQSFLDFSPPEQAVRGALHAHGYSAMNVGTHDASGPVCLRGEGWALPFLARNPIGQPVHGYACCTIITPVTCTLRFGEQVDGRS